MLAVYVCLQTGEMGAKFLVNFNVGARMLHGLTVTYKSPADLAVKIPESKMKGYIDRGVSIHLSSNNSQYSLSKLIT